VGFAATFSPGCDVGCLLEEVDEGTWVVEGALSVKDVRGLPLVLGSSFGVQPLSTELRAIAPDALIRVLRKSRRDSLFIPTSFHLPLISYKDTQIKF
jgi:hypothetical protein